MNPAWQALAAALHPDSFPTPSSQAWASGVPMFPVSPLGSSTHARATTRSQLIQNEAVIAATGSLIESWRQAGWFSQPVNVHLSDPDDALSYAEVHAHTKIDRAEPHVMFVSLNDQAQTPAFLGDTSSPLGRCLSTPIFRHALLVGHEVAHTAYQDVWKPFQPTALVPLLGKLGPDRHTSLLRDMHDDILGPCATNLFDPLLEESFADVYGAMMVVRSAQGHPQAWAEVDLWIQVRQSNHVGFLQAVSPDRDVMAWDSPEAVFKYDTARALQLMKQRQMEWMTCPPAQMRDLALGVISDAWLIQAAERITGEAHLHQLLNTGHNRFANRLNVAAGEGRWREFLLETTPALSHHPVHQAWCRAFETPALCAALELLSSSPIGGMQSAQAIAHQQNEENRVRGETLNAHYATDFDAPEEIETWVAYETNTEAVVRTLVKDVLPWVARDHVPKRPRFRPH